MGSEQGSDPNSCIFISDFSLVSTRRSGHDQAMARQARICIPGIALHIVQRGNNRQKCFLQREDYSRYLGYLSKSAEKYEAQIHAYVLMTNHVHLLMTPNHDFSASKMMQNLGRSYVLAFNKVHDRTGTLWEGRFRSFPVTTEEYLFACYRYIELNPVRAELAETPDKYPWSSYRANALGAPNAVVQPRKEWLELGRTTNERCRCYQRMFGLGSDDRLFAEIRASTKSGSEPGSDPE